MTTMELELAAALLMVLNVEGAAKHGPIKGLDVSYHFREVRKALNSLAAKYDFEMDVCDEVLGWEYRQAHKEDALTVFVNHNRVLCEQRGGSDV